MEAKIFILKKRRRKRTNQGLVRLKGSHLGDYYFVTVSTARHHLGICSVVFCVL